MTNAHRPSLVALALLALALTGCIGTTAAQSVGGKAFVVRGSFLGTSVYNCDATGARPVCYEVTEEAAK